MKNFISIDLESNLQSNQIVELILKELPQFEWHQGDSDTQGVYVSGKNKEGVQIKFWLDEYPIAASLSFRGMHLDTSNQETVKQQIFHEMIRIITKHIGKIVRTIEN
jgi:hypothetical protein